MRYILTEGYSLCGYKRLPFAIYNNLRGVFSFFNQWQYKLILDCDGNTDIDVTRLSTEESRYINTLVKEGVIRLCEGNNNDELHSYQRYVRFDNVYKNMVHWSITGKCNYRCKHCLMSCPEGVLPEMTLEQCLDAIKQMRQCGVRKVTLTGGEPLVHPNFMDIVQGIIDNGLILESILTNGALVTRELLETLKAKNIRCLFQMSFDGIGWHDWLRGIPGAEEKVINAFKLCQEYGFPTSSSMCLNRNNVGTIRESVNLLADLGVSGVKITNTEISGEWIHHPEYFLNEEEVYEAIAEYIPQYIEDGARIGVTLNGCFEYEPGAQSAHIPCCSKGTEGNYNSPLCMAVTDGFYLSPKGVVMPCQPFIDKDISDKYDSIFDRSLKEILNESAYLDDTSCKLREYIDKNEKCGKCEYLWLCHGGCRSRAIGRSELDYLHIDEEHCKFFLNGWYDRFSEIIEDAQRQLVHGARMEK